MTSRSSVHTGGGSTNGSTRSTEGLVFTRAGHFVTGGGEDHSGKQKQQFGAHRKREANDKRGKGRRSGIHDEVHDECVRTYFLDPGVSAAPFDPADPD